MIGSLIRSVAARRLTATAPDGTGSRWRATLGRGAIVDARVPQVSGKALGGASSRFVRRLTAL